jgi:tetratricopeptide (TPR) repeat protein
MRDDRLPGDGLLRRRRPCYPDRMQPVDLGFALKQELERGAVATATLDQVIALLDGAAQPVRAAFLEPLFCAVPAQEDQLAAIREHLEARPLERVALLDVLLTWTSLEQPLVASLVASLVARDEATATATLRKLAASLAAPYPDHFEKKPVGLRPRMPLFAVVQACRRDERAAVAAAADAVPGPWQWNAEELEQAASSLALDNDAASVRELMQRAVVLAPESARCWTLLGTALTQLRDDGEALPALVRATELGDEDDAWYNRACVHMRHGQVDAAIAALRRAVASQPELRVDAIGDSDFATILDHPEFMALIEA